MNFLGKILYIYLLTSYILKTNILNNLKKFIINIIKGVELEC